VINRWFSNVVSTIQTIPIEIRDDYLDVESLGGERCLFTSSSSSSSAQSEVIIVLSLSFFSCYSTGPGRMKPFYGPMTVKRDLTKAAAPGKDEKEVLHCEFDLRGSDLTYTSGDALGIYPLNNPSEVDSLLLALGSRAIASQLVDIPTTYAPVPEGRQQATTTTTTIDLIRKFFFFFFLFFLLSLL
jgi:sulfite reductase alpha subunit-like flavoprotein